MSLDMVPGIPTLVIETSSPTSVWAIDVAWNITGATHYSVYYHDQPISSSNLSFAIHVGDVDTNNATVELPGLGTWYLAVTATDGDGTSDLSNSPSIEIVAFVGPSPAILVTKSPVATVYSAEVRWSKIDGSKVYELLRHTEEITGLNEAIATLVGTFGPDIDSFTDRIPTTGTYFYRVSALGWDASKYDSSNAKVMISQKEIMRNWYVTKAFVGSYARLHDPSFTDDEITDEMMQTASDDVDSKLIHWDIFPDSIDLNNETDKRVRLMGSFLRGAALFHVLDLLNAMEKMVWSPGILEATTSGSTRIEMQRAMPMFFFAKGIEEGFFQLIATDTPRMRGFWFTKRFKDLYERWNKDGTFKRFPVSLYQHDKYINPRAKLY